MTVQESILDQHPFFQDVDTRHVAKIARHASEVSFDTGRLIFRQGEAARQFYLLTRGRVALEVFAPGHGPLTLMTLEDDDVLGWSWLFEPYIWRFDARALEDTRAIAIDGAGLRAQCEEDYELGYRLMTRLMDMITQRLVTARLQLLDMYGVRR